MERKEFDLFELIRLLSANKTFIIVFVAVVSIAAVIYSLLTPQIWSSSASFYAVGETGTALPFDLPGLGGLTSKFLDTGGGDQSINFVTAMKSREFSEDVIRKFNLINYFKITKPDSLARMDKALKLMHQKMVAIEFDQESGLIKLRIESKSKKMSREIADHYLSKLEHYNKVQKLTKGKMNREFLEGRVNSTRAQIDSLILAVRDFQTRNKAIDLEAQTTALIESYSSLVAEKMKLDVEYELARKNYSADSPVLADIQTKRTELQKQIRSIENNSGGGIKPTYMVNISSLPDLGSKFAQLKMNLEIQTKVFEFLYPQYEAARLEELRDMPTLDILDRPREAGLRVRPRRAIICLAAAFLSFIVASALVLIGSVFSNNKDRIKEIRDAW
ncbi:MAG TPA: Wzz/FepE/Etk N-terminal domain-containing protein [Candidatus Cloacimonadota bacterium]|nr:Wzz/FepE/Etk N-terminal domain-containing protein [Candidatus Cloacimonadota bacterium]